MSKLVLPAELQTLVGAAQFEADQMGKSGTQVFRVAGAESLPCYLKVGTLHLIQHLNDEKERLLWLQGRLPVPQVLYYGEAHSKAYLLLSEIPGKISCAEVFQVDLPRLVQKLAHSLRMIHNLPLAGCPFDRRLPVMLAQAKFHIESGQVDESDFDDELLGLSAETVFQQLLTQQADLDSEDLVFTHGDFCLPNVLLDQFSYEVTGFIDWGRAGVADRYQDLALATCSLEYNWGAEWVELFFAEYGIPAPKINRPKVEFYRLLDEFF